MINAFGSLTQSSSNTKSGKLKLSSKTVEPKTATAEVPPQETVQLQDTNPRESALGMLDGIAKRGEFWDCGGVKENHLSVIEESLRPKEDLLEATEAFVSLFETYKGKMAAPTTPTNQAWPKLAAMARPGESMKSVVANFADLVGFESKRQLLDGARHGMRSMENINAQLKPEDDRTQAVSEFKKDPDAFFQSGSEPKADPKVFGHVNHRNVDTFSYHQVPSSQVIAMLEEPPATV